MSRRPTTFWLNKGHRYAGALRFALLGQHPGSNLVWDDSSHHAHTQLSSMDPATDWRLDPLLNRYVLDFTASGSESVDCGDGPPDGSENFSWVWWGNPGAVNQLQITSRTGNNQGVELLQGPGGISNLSTFRAHSTSQGATSSAATTFGEWYHFAMVRNASDNIACYVNGKLHANLTGWGSGSLNGVQNIKIANRNDSLYADCSVSDVMLFQTDVDDTFIARCANPGNIMYGNLLATKPSIFLPLGDVFGAPTAYTIDVDLGVYTLTGQDPTLRVGKQVNIDAGSYSVTGQDPTLTKQYKLPVDAGSYTISGKDPTLTYAGQLQLDIDAGSYTLTGYDPTLSVVKKINIDAGSYTLTGQDPILTADRKLLIDAGSYTLTGQDPTLTYSGETRTRVPGVEYRMTDQRVHYKVPDQRPHYISKGTD